MTEFKSKSKQLHCLDKTLNGDNYVLCIRIASGCVLTAELFVNIIHIANFIVNTRLSAFKHCREKTTCPFN